MRWPDNNATIRVIIIVLFIQILISSLIVTHQLSPVEE